MEIVFKIVEKIGAFCQEQIGVTLQIAAWHRFDRRGEILDQNVRAISFAVENAAYALFARRQLAFGVSFESDKKPAVTGGRGFR